MCVRILRYHRGIHAFFRTLHILSVIESPVLQVAFFLLAALTTALIISLGLWRREVLHNSERQSNSLSVPPYTHIVHPIPGSLQYFRHWDFLRRATKNGAVSFHLANQKCMAISMENRQDFFNNSRTCCALAYAVMLGATPSMNKAFLSSVGVDITLGGRSNIFLFALLRKEPDLLLLYSYADEAIGSLGATTNPFETIYPIILRLTVNTLAASSVAASPTICSALARIFHGLDQSGTPFMILFPWFLGWARMQRFYLMGQFYGIVNAAIDGRRKDGRNDDDLMQYLIDAGLSSIETTQASFHPPLSCAYTDLAVAAYLLCDLAAHPVYLAQVREELEGFVALFNADEALPFSTRIQRQFGSDMRQPLHRLNDSVKEIEMGDILVQNGTIITFHTSFIHHNEDIYADPLTWDPQRFSDERGEDKAVPMSFCGWGLGKHPCCGTKFAKFQIFLLTALMVSSYDIQIANKEGQPIPEMPPVELDNTVMSAPNPQVHLKLSARY
ncbi:cytochrome P450 [Mycena vulgaris]|nr:cytochrome P450 [Mycena vulgaris]